jgi:hypothetical protein
MAKNSQNLSKIRSKSINSRNQVQPQIQQINNQQKPRSIHKLGKNQLPPQHQTKQDNPQAFKQQNALTPIGAQTCLFPFLLRGVDCHRRGQKSQGISCACALRLIETDCLEWTLLRF